MAAPLTITLNGTALPGEITALKRGDELLWSEGTGRGATNGLLTGSIVARKQTWHIEWGVITQAQYNSIRNLITGNFQTLVVVANGQTLANIVVYRGNIDGEYMGTHGGTAYWKGVTVDLIER